MPKVRVRFAPSPTGYLHIGGLRTALYNYLFAKRHGGEYLLRIEDTDRARFVEGGVENILESLDWAGITSDEGPYIKDGQVLERGSHGPYRQSARLERYQKYAEELLAKGRAYHCFCALERLEEMRAGQIAAKVPPMYDGLCRTLSPTEIKERLASGTGQVIRLAVEKGREVVFEDMIRGQVSFASDTIDDQVLLKSDGYPTYHLANVVDDHLMEITHVLRAEEWLTSTPKHLLLYEAFGWTAPQFAHLPLLLNPDRSKLSKRQGDVAALDYRAAGYLPEALLNFIALLGWAPSETQEIFSVEELAKLFDISKIGKAGTVFNREKLDWLNGQYLRGMVPSELHRRLKAFGAEIDFKKFSNPVLALQAARERAVTLKDIARMLTGLLQAPTYEGLAIHWKKSDPGTTAKILKEIISMLKALPDESWNEKQLEIDLKEWIAAQGYDNGTVLWPLRVSLSGQEKSAPPFTLLELFGKSESVKRIESAIVNISHKL